MLVTGAARGIGAEIARCCSAEGASVFLTDIADDAGRETATALGKRARYCRLDVSSPDDWADAVAACEAELGPVSVLVSNAAGWTAGNVLDVTVEDWARTFSVIVDGAFHGIRAVLPGMRTEGRGSIVAISSSVGVALGAPDFAAYQSAKAALSALIRHVGGTYAAEGVRANSILPGPTRTPRHHEHGFEAAAVSAAASYPIPRRAEPEEIAWAAVFLASDESSYVNASNLVVDGGSTAFLSAVKR